MAHQSLPNSISIDNLSFIAKPSHPRFVDITGKRFGRIVILGLTGITPKTSLWAGRCDCGTIKIFRYANLYSGHVQSCGCRSRELSSSRNRTHGMTNTPEYETWAAMRQRCESRQHQLYPNYGGRGITVCKRWERFENFLEDMGARPSSDHSIERRDNDGNYEPANCIWATRKQQMNNRRICRSLTIDGRTQTIAQWAAEMGMPDARLRQRVSRGWSSEQLFAPKGFRLMRKG